MAMDATFQIRMNSESKTDVENLYRSLGTPKAWGELTRDEIGAKFRKSTADITAGRMLSQNQLDAKIAGL